MNKKAEVQKIQPTQRVQKSPLHIKAERNELSILSHIKKVMKNEQITQNEIASALGIQAPQVSKNLNFELSNRGHFSIIQLLVILYYLNISITLNAGETDNPTKDLEISYDMYSKEDEMPQHAGKNYDHVLDSLKQALESAQSDKNLYKEMIESLLDEKKRMKKAIDELKKALTQSGSGHDCVGVY